MFAATAACVIFHLQWIVALAQASDLSVQDDQIVIQVHPNVEISGDRILLGDMAHVSAGSFLKQSIEQIDIGASPKPGQIIALKKRKIMYHIQSHNYLPKNLSLVCPDTVYVKRAGQKISKKQIETFLSSRLKTIYKNKTFELRQLSVRGLESYPEGKVEFSGNFDRLISKNGRLSGHVDVLVDSVPVDRISLTGKIAVWDRILFAAHSLSRGDLLKPDDFYLKTVDVCTLSHPAVHSLTAVEGKVLQTTLNKDDYLKASNLVEAPVVRKGDVITLVAVQNNLKIVTTGVSTEDGFVNELIKVENLNSGKLVRGIVTNKSQVEVVY